MWYATTRSWQTTRNAYIYKNIILYFYSLMVMLVWSRRAVRKSSHKQRSCRELKQPAGTDNSQNSRCYHHHIALVARISLTLSRHSSLSFIALDRSSGQHPVSSHSCWMYVRAGRPAFARPCVGIHKSTSLMSSSLLLQQCPTCLVRLTWIVFVMGAGGRTVGVLWGVAARTCSGLHAAFLCNCHLASSPAVLLASM